MDMTTVWLGLLPLVGFVIVDTYASARAGLISAMVLSVALLVYYYVALGDIDYSMVLESGLIVVLGLIAMKMNNSLFFKFQPVMVGVCLSLFLAYFQFFDQPYFVKLMPRMAKLVPQAAPFVNDPKILLIMGRLSWQFIIVFLVHAGLVAYSALKMKNLGWILMRLAIYPIAFLLMLANVLLIGVGGA